MKKIIVMLGLLVGLGSYSQPKNSSNNIVQSKTINTLIGSWEIIGSKSEGGGIEIIDSSNITMTYGGERKAISGFSIDFTKSPIWFDFYVKDSSETLQVKSIMEIISDDLIKWQVFMDEERINHFTAQQGELFYLKRVKIRNVVTFANEWDKKNYSASKK